jgi:type I restriction enzyme R subunit
LKNENLTRKEIIDNRLKKAGWNVADRSQVIEEFDIIVDSNLVLEAPTPYAGHQYSDYVLLGKDGKPLAVVEAKKTSVDSAIGREQAKQYCNNILATQGGDLPFCFYTNGHDIKLSSQKGLRLSLPRRSRTLLIYQKSKKKFNR